MQHCRHAPVVSSAAQVRTLAHSAEPGGVERMAAAAWRHGGGRGSVRNRTRRARGRREQWNVQVAVVCTHVDRSIMHDNARYIRLLRAVMFGRTGKILTRACFFRFCWSSVFGHLRNKLVVFPASQQNSASIGDALMPRVKRQSSFSCLKEIFYVLIFTPENPSLMIHSSRVNIVLSRFDIDTRYRCI
jgi:hypothetical protein